MSLVESWRHSRVNSEAVARSLAAYQRAMATTDQATMQGSNVRKIKQVGYRRVYSSSEVVKEFYRNRCNRHRFDILGGGCAILYLGFLDVQEIYSLKLNRALIVVSAILIYNSTICAIV